MAPPARFELATSCLEGSCSIQVSYGGGVRRSIAQCAPRGQAHIKLRAHCPESRALSRVHPILAAGHLDAEERRKGPRASRV